MHKTLVFSVLSMVAAGFNYLFYPLAARLSDVAFFGDLNTLMSLLMQGTSLLLALNVVSLFFLNNFPRAEADKQITRLQGISTSLIGTISMLLLIGTPFITSVIGIRDVASLAIIYASILLLIPSVIWSTYLQAHEQLYEVAIYNIIVSVSRIIFCAVALYYQQPLWIVVSGLLVSQLVGMAYLYLSSRERPPISFASLSYIRNTSHGQLRKFISYVFVATITLFLMGVIASYDVVVVRSLFGDVTAGHYSSMAIFGKAVYFAVATMIWPMLPAIRLADIRQSRQVLVKTLRLMILVGIVLIIGIALIKDTILPILIGKSYTIDQTLLFVLCIEQLAAVLLMTYVMYLLVQRKGRALLLLISCTSFIALFVLFAHQTAVSTAIAFLSGIVTGVLFYKGAEKIVPSAHNDHNV